MLAGGLEGTPFDLIFLHQMMTGMNVVDTVQQIRNQPDLPAMPRIILVPPAPPTPLLSDDTQSCLDGLITTPMTASSLLDAVMNTFFEYTTSLPYHRPIHHTLDVALFRAIWGAKVLLVEDHEINRRLARELLEQARLIVDGAVNGREAMEKLAESPFDIVLMDVQMPEMDGYETTRPAARI